MITGVKELRDAVNEERVAIDRMRAEIARRTTVEVIGMISAETLRDLFRDLQSGNFYEFTQYRKMLQHENIGRVLP